MPDSRDRFLQWTDCLLDSSRSPADHRTAAHDWCQWALETLHLDESHIARTAHPFACATTLPNGQAISPLEAALCLRDHRRTAVFLRAADAAVRAALELFPGETIHLLEAGCGPLAPIALTAAARYSPQQVCVTLLDLHPASLEAAQRLAAELRVTAALRTCLAADATTVRLPDTERPHIIVCEMLHRALTREPQVAATRHLTTQLRPGGFFLPERIEVIAALVHHGRLQQRMMALPGHDPVNELGPVFTLTPRAGTLLPAGRIAIPAHDPGSSSLRLLTRIQVFGDHCLTDFESAITLPERVPYPAEVAKTGALAAFALEISATPRLRCEFLPHPDAAAPPACRTPSL